MGRITEVVEITLKAQEQMARPMGRVEKALAKLRMSFKGFSNVMSMNNDTFRVAGKRISNFGSKGARMAARIRRATAGLKGFRMEMLGVMFFGMSLQRLFTGFLRPSLELVGVFDIMRTALQLLFLPIALKIMPWAIKFLTWVTKMSPELKLMIGKLVLFGAIGGFLLFVIGQFALGIGSMILVFGGLFTIIDKLIPDVRIMGVNMSSFLEAGLALGAVKFIFDGIRSIIGKILEKLLEFDFIKQIFEQLEVKIDDQKTPWENFKELLIGVWDSIKEKFKLGDMLSDIGIDFEVLKTTATDAMDKIVPEIERLNDSLEKLVGWIESIVDAWSNFKTAVDIGAGSDFDDTVNKALLPRRGGITNTLNKFNDFVVRPGQAPFAVSPNDTLVGFEGDGSNIFGGGSGVNITMNNNIGVADRDSIERIMRDVADNLIREIRRNTT